MRGRRIPVADPQRDPVSVLTKAGDYYGPVLGFTAASPAVFFLLPIARQKGIHPEARSLRHVQSPPHRFVEEADGSLTIVGSILTRWSDGSGSWHGHLRHGVWEECS